MKSLAFLVLLVLLVTDEAVYVSYETPARSYAPGQLIPVQANKLMSSDALEALDYAQLPFCGRGAATSGIGNNERNGTSFQPVVPVTQWQKALASLHGDALYDVNVFNLRMLENRYCQQLCLVDLTESNNLYEKAIQQDMHYNLLVDGMPIAVRRETDTTVSIRYFGGIPVGRRGPSQDEKRSEDDLRYSTSDERNLFVYNHYNIYITYWRVPGDSPQYRIVRTEIQPLSVAHRYDASSSVTAPVPVTLYDVTLPSCVDHDVPTLYAHLNGTAPQLVLGPAARPRPVLFTYDVLYIEYKSQNDPWKTRWNVFLRMDDGIPVQVQLFGLLVAVLIHVILAASLWIWMMRDLSYKPIVSIYGDDEEEGGAEGDDASRQALRKEQERDIQLWPLSTRLFFPPRVAQLWLSMCAGMGAQLLLAAFVFVLLFRSGIINESMGSQILLPAVIIYTVSSVVGGGVTARICGLFYRHRLRALQACGIVAIGFPLIGMLVLYLTYDVLIPETAPRYRVISNSLPLILMWIVGVVPLTLLGGWWGYVKGPFSNFPISEGTEGYQDLNVHGNGDHDSEERKTCCCWRHARTAIVFLLGGLPPVACSFVEYAYGVAGPIYVGYYSDASFYAILSFILFCTCVALVACLLFYQQIRAKNFDWWWTSFVAGVSSGFYLFILSMSWILYDYLSNESSIAKESLASYTIWFAFGSLGASLIAGFVSIGSCILMTRILYSFLMRRSNHDSPDDVDVTVEESAGEEEVIESTRRSYNLSSIMEPES